MIANDLNLEGDGVIQERWDDAFANTPDSVLDMFIAEAAQAEKEGSTKPIFDEHGKLIFNYTAHG